VLLPIANVGFVLIEGLSKPEREISSDTGATSYTGNSVDSVRDSEMRLTKQLIRSASVDFRLVSQSDCLLVDRHFKSFRRFQA